MRRLVLIGVSDANKFIKDGDKKRKKKSVLVLGSCGYSYGFTLLSYTKKGKDIKSENKPAETAGNAATPKNSGRTLTLTLLPEKKKKKSDGTEQEGSAASAPAPEKT